MKRRSGSWSLGYYGFVAVVLGTFLILVGMRPVAPGERARSPTVVAHQAGSGLVVVGSAAIAVYAWREHRKTRRASEAPTEDPKLRTLGGSKDA
jgi:hypothetical protein